jgi:penicillin-binding protein 1C
MQLARMRFGIDSRSVGGKLRQIVRALAIERRHSKVEILEAYLNLVPYGGNVEGVGAASLVYFGKEPARLTVPEALTLAVIPQSPAARRPAGDTAATALADARSRLFERWLATHRASELSAAALAVTTGQRHELPFLAPHFVDEVLKADDRSPRIATTLDLELQRLVEREVDRFVERSRKLGIENATAMLADYRSMETRAYVGSADHASEAIAGQVNGLRGRRSPGSALKPFTYALAIDEGLIHSQSMLKDTALRIADYNPENFDRDFVGRSTRRARSCAAATSRRSGSRTVSRRRGSTASSSTRASGRFARKASTAWRSRSAASSSRWKN